MSDVSQWSNTAASNNDAAPDGFPEGMPPSGVNDAAREIMAAVSRWYDDTSGGLTTAGTGNNYTLTTNNAHAALADQSLLVFRADRANTGSATLNVDGLGAKTLEAAGESLASGDMVADSIYLVVYNSTNDTYDIVNTPILSSMFFGTQENLRAVDESLADAASGAEVRGVDDSFYPVGFNLLPEQAISGGDLTYDQAHVGKDITYDEGTARALNLNNDAAIPVTGMSGYYVGPSAGTLTAQAGAGVTITYWNGASWTTTAAAGSITVGVGQGTIKKMSDTSYRINGPNLS